MSTPVLLGSTCAERLYLRERTNDRIRMIVSHVRSVEIRSCETGREMTTFGRGGGTGDSLDHHLFDGGFDLGDVALGMNTLAYRDTSPNDRPE